MKLCAVSLGRTFLMVFLLLIFVDFHSFAEDVKITTYYPSPYGSYKQLSVEDGGTEIDKYGSLQITREASNHLGSHVAFIRDGTSRMGLGYKQSSNIFGFGPGVTGTAFDPTSLSMDASGNVGLGTSTLQTTAPGGGTSGNLTANDVYLSGANQWASQAGTGTEGTLVVKTQNEDIVNDTTYQDDDNLKFNAGANETREFEFVVIFFQNAASDIKFQLAGPSLSGGGWIYATVVANLTPDNTGAYGVSSKNLQAMTYDNYVNAAYSYDYTTSAFGVLTICGAIKTASASGTVVLRWAQRVSGGATTTVYKGSYVKTKKV